MQTIKITISPKGEIEYTVEGIKGGKCREITKAIDAIAGKVLATKNTGEFCQVESAPNRLQTGR